MSDRLREVKPENKSLRAFGAGEVERAVEEVKRQEAQEREQKKAKRKFSGGGEVIIISCWGCVIKRIVL